VENLISLAKARGGFDNITAVIVQEGSPEPDRSQTTTKEFEGLPLSTGGHAPGRSAGPRIGPYLAPLLVILLGLALFLLLQ